MTTPATLDSTAAVREAVREAAAAARALRIAGRGTWLHAGRPVRAAVPLDVRALSGIVEYVPGDLTLTARAATSLAEIAAVTAAEGQWLALDPMGGDAGSLGATAATASAGPLAHAFGLPRDNVLGVEFVAGTGEIVRGGGRVVKNVAGFDLTRLTVGAWGTLGVITELTVRLRARPEVDVTVTLPLPEGGAPLADALAGVRKAPLAALALEMVSPRLARRLGLGDGPMLLARLGGNEESVRAQRGTLSAMGGASTGSGQSLAEVPADVWTRLRESEPADATIVRFSDLPSKLHATWAHALAVADRFPDALVHASLGRGVARCIIPDASLEPARVGGVVRADSFGGARIFERLPAEVWPALPAGASDRLSRGVKRVFDPANVLNPGILGDTTQ